MNPIKQILVEPTTLPAWHVVVSYKTGADVSVDCVSEDHARLVMQNYLRAAMVQKNTKVFTSSYNQVSGATTYVRSV